MPDAKKRSANVKWYSNKRRKRGKRGRGYTSIAALRVGELNRLFTARYGLELPDDDAGRDDAAIMVHHLAAMSGDPRQRIQAWIELRAPWLSVAEAKAILVDAIAKPRKWRADKLAWRMRLTAADRATLKITTIGAIDASKATRASQRAQRKHEYDEQRRRQAGMTPRHAYEHASTSRAQPWTMLGISRASWYRKGKPKPPSETP